MWWCSGIGLDDLEMRMVNGYERGLFGCSDIRLMRRFLAWEKTVWEIIPRGPLPEGLGLCS